jgi:hypothetical protein
LVLAIQDVHTTHAHRLDGKGEEVIPVPDPA